MVDSIPGVPLIPRGPQPIRRRGDASQGGGQKTPFQQQMEQDGSSDEDAVEAPRSKRPTPRQGQGDTPAQGGISGGHVDIVV